MIRWNFITWNWDSAYNKPIKNLSAQKKNLTFIFRHSIYSESLLNTIAHHCFVLYRRWESLGCQNLIFLEWWVEAKPHIYRNWINYIMNFEKTQIREELYESDMKKGLLEHLSWSEKCWRIQHLNKHRRERKSSLSCDYLNILF